MNILNNYQAHEIDWDMTPEDAVALYLEWGNNGYGGSYNNRVVSKSDFSLYFVAYTWDEVPKVFLIHRNSEGSNELAEIEMPEDLAEKFLDHVGHNKGVYGLTDELKDWLKSKMH